MTIFPCICASGYKMLLTKQVIGSIIKLQVHECLHISKKHGLKTLYVCVRAFTSAGVMQQSCQVLKPILGQHTTNTVYDFDTSSVPWSSIKEVCCLNII